MSLGASTSTKYTRYSPQRERKRLTGVTVDGCWVDDGVGVDGTYRVVEEVVGWTLLTLLSPC